MSTTEQGAYVLGTHDDELERLGLQAHLWRNQAMQLWEKAGFKRGQTLLDLGCGPGYATVDLARIAGPAGQVLAVDASERYVEHVKAQPRVHDAAPVRAWVQDVQRLDLPEACLDGAWERWVLCFVPAPEAALQSLARALKPGGTLALYEYVNYEGMRLAPRSPAFERVVQAAADSFRAQGGDPNLALRLPGLLEQAGLEVTHLEPVARLARPADPLWQWPGTFFRSYAPALVERGLLTAAERAAFEADWRAWSERADGVFYSPVLAGVVARKPA